MILFFVCLSLFLCVCVSEKQKVEFEVWEFQQDLLGLATPSAICDANSRRDVLPLHILMYVATPVRIRISIPERKKTRRDFASRGGPGFCCLFESAQVWVGVSVLAPPPSRNVTPNPTTEGPDKHRARRGFANPCGLSLPVQTNRISFSSSVALSEFFVLSEFLGRV